MSMFFTFLLYIAAYIWIGQFTIWAANRITRSIPSGDDYPIGMFWPFVWIVSVAYGFYKVITSPVQSVKAVMAFFKAPPLKEPKAGELFKGCPKPSSILVGLIAKKILEHPELFQENTWDSDRLPHDKRPPLKIVVAIHRVDRGLRYVKVDGDKLLDLTQKDVKVLCEAYREALALTEARQEAEERAKREYAAVDAIERLLGLPKPAPMVPLPETVWYVPEVTLETPLTPVD